MNPTATRLPDFIGIGAPKAGTTWITRLLTQNPAIFMPQMKETHFFDYPYDQNPFSKYAGFFAAATPGQIVGEFSTDYLASPEAPARIARHLPGVKLIVSLRNPIDQIYSNYWHALRQGFHCSDRSMPDFTTALERHRGQLLDPAFYGHHLERWLAIFPREQILIIFQEDIARRPSDVAAELWRFLGMSPVANEAAMPSRGGGERQGVAPRSHFAGAIYNALYFSANRWVLRPISRLFGYQASMQLIEKLRLRRLGETLFFRRGYPPLTPELRAELVVRFTADIQLLGRLTGRDLQHWL